MRASAPAWALDLSSPIHVKRQRSFACVAMLPLKGLDLMSVYLTVDRIDRTLSNRQRTEMGLGPIEKDPRDTACFVQVMEETPTNMEVLGEFWFPYERAPMTPVVLLGLLRARAQQIIDGDIQGRGEAQLVGRKFSL